MLNSCETGKQILKINKQNQHQAQVKQYVFEKKI